LTGRGDVMKKVLVATGTSENKKIFTVNYIRQYLSSKNIEAEVLGANIYDVDASEIKPDVIVAIGPAKFPDIAPIIQGTAFVTRIGMEAACDGIIAALER